MRHLLLVDCECACRLQIKYYKGLGTSNTDEAREYFSRIDMHRNEFEWQGGPIC